MSSSDDCRIRPQLLVSLVVGSAHVPANQAACRVAVESFQASDAPALTDAAYCAYVNGDAPHAYDLATWLLDRGFRVACCTSHVVGIGAARNHVMRQAEVAPDYVVELHNDMVLPAVWLAPMLQAFDADARLAALGAAFHSSSGYFGSRALKLDLASGDTSALTRELETANAAARVAHADSLPRIRRGLSCPAVKRWRALADPRVGGPYYPSEFEWGWEDTDEVRRLEAAGYRIGVTLDAWAYHAYLYSRLATQDAWQRWPGACHGREAFYRKWRDADDWLRAYERDLQRMLQPGNLETLNANEVSTHG